MGFLLYILSRILQAVLVTIGIIYGLIKCFWGRQFIEGLKNADRKFLILAKSIDKFGNVACSELFNDTLLKNSTWKFGYINETISGVLGVNKGKRTLSKFGNWICKDLDLIDKNHVENAAIDDLKNITNSNQS